MTDVVVLLDTMHHRQSVHHGHHHIGDNEVGHLLLGNLQSLFAIGSLQHGVVAAEDAYKEGAKVVVIFHYQESWSHLIPLSVTAIYLFHRSDIDLPHILVGDIGLFVSSSPKHFIYEVEHLLSVAEHHLEVCTCLLCQSILFEHLVHGATDEGQWCAQTMTDVGEELRLHLIQFTFKECFITQCLDIHCHIDNGYKNKEIEHPYPGGLPEGGMGIDIEGGDIIHPYPIAIGTLYQQAVMARRESVEGGAMTIIHIVPILIYPLYLIGILQLIPVFIVDS